MELHIHVHMYNKEKDKIIASDFRMVVYVISYVFKAKIKMIYAQI